MTLDLGREGKSRIVLPISHSSHESAYGQIELPIGVIRNGDGPTVLLVAGNHGDEFEGQFALRRLFREAECDRVKGRIIVLPCANPPAVFAATRTSPVDSGNLNRSFPGDQRGGPTSAIANAISSSILPQVDYLVDLHSGGSSLEYVPCTIVQRVVDRRIFEAQRAMARAFGAPRNLVYDVLPGLERSLSGTAIGLGIPSMATELGGGGGCTPSTVEIGYSGVRALLHHLTVLDHGVTKPCEDSLVVNTETDFVRSPEDGFFEPVVGLGDTVRQGQVAGVLHRFLQIDELPREVRFRNDGIVVCRRPHTRCRRGDCLFHTAADERP